MTAFRAEKGSTYPFPEMDSFSCYSPETGRLFQDFFLLLCGLGNHLDLYNFPQGQDQCFIVNILYRKHQ